MSSTVDYGRGAAGDRRRWLHKRLAEMHDDAELPTTVSSLYYDGVQSGQWPSDSEALALAARRAHAAGRTITRGRTSRQNISDDVQWLVAHDLVDEDWLADLSRSVRDHRSPRDLYASTYTYVEELELSPWGDQPDPVVIVESLSVTSALDADAARYSVPLAPLKGMSGTTFLRRDVVSCLTRWTPVAYIGDWNPSGDDIARNAEQLLRERGWHGTWELLAVTDDDAARLPRKVKVDTRYRPHRRVESVEAEALGTTQLRRRLTTWLDSLLPDEFTWEDHDAETERQRAAVLALLEQPDQ